MLEPTLPLLTTKLYVPRPRPDRVVRRRLLEVLDRGLELGHSLTLVAAPAGFGKSTLVSAWVSALPTGWRVAWLSLGPEDNDPILFWSYVIAALQTAVTPPSEAPSPSEAPLSVLAELLHSPQPPDVQSIVIELANILAQQPRPEAPTVRFVLVLDDYHHITASAVHNSLAFLLERIPSTLHLVLLTRSDPGSAIAPASQAATAPQIVMSEVPLPVASLRARGRVTEVRAQSLRFTAEETGAFCNETMRLSLAPEEIVTLAECTEGWVAGLQLAALSLQGRPASGVAFAGNHRFVIDYLVEEVLDRQSPAVQSFLLKTSILRSLSGPLCDAVAGGTDGQASLEALEASQLFVVPLDDTRKWYRYHHLFAEFLQNRLHQRMPGEVADLHSRAARWYAGAGQVREAVDHALEAGAFEMATDLVVSVATAHLVRGDVGTLRAWLEALPEPLLAEHAQLGIIYALVNMYALRFDVMTQWLARARATLPPEPVTDPATQRLWGRWYAVHGYWVRLVEQDFSASLADSIQSLKLLPDPHAQVTGGAEHVLMRDLCFWRDLARLNAGFTEVMGQDNITAAAAAFREVAGGPCSSLNPYAALTGLSFQGRMEVFQGRLHAAAATYRRGLALASRLNAGSWQLTGYLVYGMAELAWLWNRIEEAQEGLAQIESNSGQMDNAEIRLNVLMLRIRIACALDDRDALACSLDIYRALIDHMGLEGLRAQVAALETDVALTQAALGYVHDPGVVRRWLAEQDVTLWRDRVIAATSGTATAIADLSGQWMVYVTLARALIAQGRADEGLMLLGSLAAWLEDSDAGLKVWGVCLLRALAQARVGNLPTALATLVQVLPALELEGCVRAFVQEGAPMARLLSVLQAQGLSEPIADFVAHVLDAFPPSVAVGLASVPPALSFASGPARPNDKLLEPLTERELEILSYLGTDLSTPAIADALYVAASTVRTHVKSIYAKLAVHTRDEAVARAQSLGLM